MNVDKWVFGFCCVCGLFGLGWITHEWAEEQKPKPLEIRRPHIYVVPAQGLIPCPVTPNGIEEWRRTCNAEKRNEAIKPKGKM